MGRTLALAAFLALSALAQPSSQTAPPRNAPAATDADSLRRESPAAQADFVAGNVPTGEGISGYSVYVWDEHEGFRIVVVDAIATDVNNHGDIVGSQYACGPEATGASCTPHGFIWSASAGVVDLGAFRPDSVDDHGGMRGSCTDGAGGVEVPCVMRDGKVTALCDDADQSCILGQMAPPQAPAGMLRPSRALPNAAPVPATTAKAPPLVAGMQVVGAVAAAALTPTQIENAKPGTTEWKLTNRGYATGAIEGYASETSVNRGSQIRLFVNTAAPSFTMDIFRMGYYGGAGARRMLPTITASGTKQVIPAPDALGLVECNWENPYVLTIPANADPTEWMSGIYLVKLTESVNKKQQYIVFAVRDDARASDLLLAQAVNTYQAYSPWGGKSLYGTIANRSDHANGARKVSFSRPYYGEQGDGVGQFFSWELAYLQFLEREGYDVTYATNVDVDRYPDLLRTHKAFLSVGHDEYWSWRMRDNVEAARDGGVSLGFFSGNTSYWQVRYENGVETGQPFRTMVGYKSSWRDDPMTPDYLKTNQFRLSPVNRSEDRMIGVMYVTQARPIFTVEDASHWIFTATGLKNGDTLKNTDGKGFLGYEVDSMGPGTPANARRVGHSPVTANGANFSDMTVYRAASGATVFATGSINWSVTVPQAQQMIRNVLARFISNAFADTVPVRPPLPAPFRAVDIGNTGRAGFVSLSSANGFTLNGAGQDTQSSVTDALYYAHQPLSGDGEIVVQVTGLQRAFGYRSGIMIRESLDPKSKYASVVVRAAGSTTPPEGAELRVRDVVGTKSRVIASRDYKMPNWIKLARSGSTFTSWTSTDGVSWTVLGSVTIPMATNVLIGTSAASARYGVWITARFENVSVRTSAQQPSTVVIRASDVTRLVGNWTKVADPTAADATALHNPNANAVKIATALATPVNYFETTFSAQAGVAYHLWVRLKAQNNYFGNDSIYVQFSDAENPSQAPIYRINTPTAAAVVLQETDNGPIREWGWADQGWNGNGTHIYFAESGTHTIRVQQREDGVMIDQIILSPSTYLGSPPGAQNNDTTIVPR